MAEPRAVLNGPPRPLRPGSSPAGARPPARTPPPRPALTSELAPPRRPSRPARPGPVRGGAAAALAACVAGLVGLAGIGAEWQLLERRLSAEAGAARPTAPAGLVHDGVQTTGIVVVAAVAVVIVATLVSAVLVARGRRGGRWALTAAAIGTLVVALALQAFLAGAPVLDRAAFLVQAGLAVLASGLILAPSARAWARLS